GFIIFRVNDNFLTIIDTANGYEDRFYNDIEEVNFAGGVSLDLTSLTFTTNGLGWGTPLAHYDDHLGTHITYGYNVNDKIYGGSGIDIIYGRLGNDELYGEASHDELH